jgi:hypothetical protein
LPKLIGHLAGLEPSAPAATPKLRAAMPGRPSRVTGLRAILAAERISRIMARRLSGMTFKEIAADEGVSMRRPSWSEKVRSPWSLTRDQYHPQRGISPGYSGPSNAKADGGHLVRSPSKGGGPASVRRDAAPVQGGESAAPLEQALNRGDRS